MNGIDPTAATRPTILARLQATMPPPGQESRGETPQQESPVAPGPQTNPRVSDTTFTASSRLSSARDPFPSFRDTQTKRTRNVFQRALDAISAHRWLIVSLSIVGGVLGYVYTTQLCVPLYRIQASLELQNPKSDYSADTFAQVLQSQSLMLSALSAMSETERRHLIETPRIPALNPKDPNETLHARLTVLAIASAQVIDLQLISPNRQAGVDFLNALIRCLVRRTPDTSIQDANAASALLPLDATTPPAPPVDTISVIDPAMASVNPVGPNLVMNVLLGLLGGVGFSVLLALVRGLTNNTFAGPGSLSQVLGMRELGAIPQRKLLTAGSAGPEVAAQIDANDESLRYLRSSLLYHPGRQDVRCLAFTSAAPGEGKTTVVTNLSMSLAATGRRVLVIDGDLRRPRLYKVLQVPQGPGLADLLRRDPAGPPAVLSKYVSPTSFQNLYVLPPGAAGNDSPELLAGPLLAKLIRDIGKSFDFVLIDTPPLLACSDARNYARAVEGVVLVVRSSETQKRAALVARDMLLADGATIIGTVLTGWRQVYPAYNYPSSANYVRS